MLNNKGESYITVAIKIIISVALGGLLWWGFSVIFNQSFITIPFNQLKTSYSYSNGKSTYQNVIKDGAMEKTGDKPVLPTIIPAVQNEVANPDVPSPPTNPVLAQDGVNISVSWSAPLRNGGAQVLGYYLYIDGELVTQSLIADLTYTITGVNTSEHKIEITAVNKKGESTPVVATFKTNALVPNAPTNVKTSASGRSITVTWAAPTSDGGDPIIGYNVYMNDVQQNQNPISGTTYKVDNLKAGNYEFRVTAVNSVGSSKYSLWAIITLKTAPDPPINTAATTANQSVMINWEAPQNDGGSAILGYNVYLNEQKQNSSLISGNNYTLNAVSAGGYKVYVTAVNQYGESFAASVANPISVISLPGFPGNVQGQQGDSNSILVSWTKPVNTGNSIITGYNVYIDDIKVNTDPVTVDGTTQAGAFLANKNYCSGSHSVSVSAINEVGEGTPYYGNLVVINTIPGAPQAPSVVLNNNIIHFTWAAPVDTGAMDINGYNVYVDGDKVNDSLVPSTGYSFGLLSSGSHVFEVRAENDLGEGAGIKTSMTVPDSVVINGLAQTELAGAVTGGGQVYKGSTVTLFALPFAGYAFDHWELNGIPVSSNASYSITAVKNADYTAVFKKIA